MWEDIKKAPISAWFGFSIILFYLFLMVFADVIAPYGEREIVGYEFEPWGKDYLLGTDSL